MTADNITYSGFISLPDDKDPAFDRQEGQLIFSDHAFTMEYEKKVNRLATPIDISLCSDGAPRYRINAIWDTGSVTSCISESMARKMGLQPAMSGVGVTAAGQLDISYYFLDIHISEDMVFHNVKVAGFPLERHDVDFLIGMDIISKGNLQVKTADGRTTVLFETK